MGAGFGWCARVCWPLRFFLLLLHLDYDFFLGGGIVDLEIIVLSEVIQTRKINSACPLLYSDASFHVQACMPVALMFRHVCLWL